MIKSDEVTIIIPHLGANQESEYSLDECLKSLKETTESKVLVVTNGTEKTCQHMGDIDMVKQGQCKAVNTAAATVSTEYIFVTNDDMVYAPGWWERLTNDFEGTEFICPNLVEPRPGAPPFLTYFCGGAGGDFEQGKWLLFAKEHSNEDDSEVGFNLPFLIKKELWDTIGGYDINYDPWGSNGDSDLQAKIHLAGVYPVRNRRCIVYHFSQTSGTFNPENHSFWEKNYAYFQEKWGFERQPTDKVWYSQEIINYDKLIYKPDWMGKYGQPK